MGRIKAMQKTGHKAHDFSPFFWHVRLDEPNRLSNPAKIFVCSMGDLFGDWVPWKWQEKIIRTAAHNPQHTFQFLTKNPKVLKQFNPWPSNCWVGTTVTNQADMDERAPWLMKVDASVRFISHEPLMGGINIYVRPVKDCHWADPDDGCCTHPERVNPECFIGTPCSISLFQRDFYDWAIIGAMTGPGAVKAKPEWVEGLVNQYQAAVVPLFIKDNLNYLGRGGIQEFP